MKKWNNKTEYVRRLLLSLLLVGAMGILGILGMDFIDVTIRTADGNPLIDLDVMIVPSLIESPPSKDVVKVEPQEEKAAVELVLSGMELQFQGNTYQYQWEERDFTGFRAEKLSAYQDVTIILVDDYAEAHAYRKVLSILEEAKKLYGVDDYKEERREKNE